MTEKKVKTKHLGTFSLSTLRDNCHIHSSCSSPGEWDECDFYLISHRSYRSEYQHITLPDFLRADYNKKLLEAEEQVRINEDIKVDKKTTMKIIKDCLRHAEKWQLRVNNIKGDWYMIESFIRGNKEEFLGIEPEKEPKPVKKTTKKRKKK